MTSSLDLATVLQAIGPYGLTGEPARDLAFSGVVTDSRQAVPGSLFVALRGERDDGHDFVADARRRGAAAVLSCRPDDGRDPGAGARSSALPLTIVVPDTLRALQGLASSWRSQQEAKVVAVTGSIGKTTTKETIASVLSRRFAVHRSLGNMNTEIGLPLSLLGLRPEHEVSVLEMGMYALGEISALCRMARPRIGVVTNVGPTHLERMGTLDRTAHAKSELVE
jgi:UDP-N-acetylmuramoyl-tripeptide--D-alanyl-D-alanine ligase